MKNVSSAFLTMLESLASLVEADLYTITLLSGTALYYTSAQQNIVYGGNTYVAANTTGAGGILANPLFNKNTGGTPFETPLTASASVSDGWSVAALASAHTVMLEGSGLANDVLIRLVGGTSVPANGSINTYVRSATYTVSPGMPFTLTVDRSVANNVALPSGITVTLRTYIEWKDGTGALISTTVHDVSGSSIARAIDIVSGNAPSAAIFADVTLQAIVSNSNGTATTVGSGGQLPADMRWYGATLTEYSTPGFHRGTWRCSRGMDADDLEVDIVFDASTRILGQTPAAFANNGGFDGATLRLDKALAPDWSNPVVNGVVNLFTGIIGEIKSGSSKVALTVNSMLLYLNAMFPRNYLLPQCNHALFDSGCALSKAAYAINGTVSTTPGASTSTTFYSNCTQADGWFALGSVVWLTGANAGKTSVVKSYANANGSFTLIYPLNSPPANGDTFTAYPGCDKLQNTCSSKFNNLAHFRGFPYAPTPETLDVGGTGSVAPVSVGGNGSAGLSRLPRGPGGQFGNFKQF